MVAWFSALAAALGKEGAAPRLELLSPDMSRRSRRCPEGVQKVGKECGNV